MIHQWCIVLCHGNFKRTELYAMERWAKVITEVPDTAYFPIYNPLIKNSDNTEVTPEWEEQMRITLKSTIFVNTNELRSKGYEVDNDNNPNPDNTLIPVTWQDTPP